ncbi:MAG: acyl-CoA thioesterase [Clostridia bacterium]|nr:acyl-CoA thioesterase [Clostridia bacterium]
MKGKTVNQSRTQQVQILMPSHINGYNRLFGGRLMEWIDVVAGVVARRHSGREVTTACIDQLVFEAPAFLNETVVLEGVMTYAGRTSMEVRVDTYAEAPDGERRRVNRAYLVMVALDENNRPALVPRLIPETTEEKLEYRAAEERREARNQRS